MCFKMCVWFRNKSTHVINNKMCVWAYMCVRVHMSENLGV